jgi:DNA-binding PadR family transcriptional regulator
MHYRHGPLGGPVRGPSVSGRRFFERGGMKFVILGALKEKPRHGYDIIRDMEERSGGFYSPSPGAVYPTLQALEDQDFVTSVPEDGKKVYTITDAGLAYLEEQKERAAGHRERWESHWAPGPQGEGWSAVEAIRDSLGEIRRAVRNTTNDPARLKEVGDVLEEAAGKIRDILKR